MMKLPYILLILTLLSSHYACNKTGQAESNSTDRNSRVDSVTINKQKVKKEGKPLPTPSGTPNDESDFNDYAHPKGR